MVPRACERCWRRKQKCSRDYPCSQCNAASTTCIQRRLGSVIDSAHSESGQSYIEALKMRIHALENGTHETTSAQLLSPSSTQETPEQHVIYASQSPNGNSQSRVAAESSTERQPRHDLQVTMQEASYLSLSAMAERTDRERFPMEGLSSFTLMCAATAISGANPTSSLTSNTILSESLSSFRQHVFADASNFTRANADEPLKNYSNFLMDSFPFMSSEDLFGMYEQVMQSLTSGTVDQFSRNSTEKLLLVYIGVATGVLLSSNYSFKEAWATELSEKAMKLLPLVFDNANDLAMVHCLTALTIHSLFTTLGGSTWHLLGFAMTRCIATGMHTMRVSDPNSDVQEKVQSNRAFWALFILDTYISTNMDRPFCLNEQDILVSPPSTPSANATYGSDARYRYLIQHAQILRSIRQDEETDVFCYSINLRHWDETFPWTDRPHSFRKSQLLTQGYVELLKHKSFFMDPNHRSIIDDIESECATYLTLLEEQLDAHLGAPFALEALHVFTIGILFSRRSTPNEMLNLGAMDERLTRRQRAFQCMNILTLLSMRYSAVRCLREILSEHIMLSSASDRPNPQNRLRELVRGSDIAISSQLHNLIFSEAGLVG